MVKLNSGRHGAQETAPLTVSLAQLDGLVAAASCCLATAPQVLAVVGRAHAAGYYCKAQLSSCGALVLVCRKLSDTAGGLEVCSAAAPSHVAHKGAAAP